MLLFFVQQKTAYVLRISDWSSDVCSSDLLSQCEGQLMLARVRGELAKNLAGGDDPRCDRRHDAQDGGPVALDERFIDLTSDQRSHIGRRRVGREGIESFLREIADTGGEPVAEQGAGGEHMIGEAHRVEVGRAHVRTPAPNALRVRRLQLEKKKIKHPK